ncbi:hypothetical protein O6H91_02G007400 [Diphasiastrum complanatum]|uniref:Uncharacterized protein n=1 Tax=Diphasiastrum complanatum TaxID=34168 RepID=A0ACC2ECR1_DIPCM|nr:hypothetical protein O6H91_02G007400 [Diphasiastrum complanatum]
MLKFSKNLILVILDVAVTREEFFCGKYDLRYCCRMKLCTYGKSGKKR